jgi:hypothetical protein
LFDLISISCVVTYSFTGTTILQTLFFAYAREFSDLPVAGSYRSNLLVCVDVLTFARTP